MIVLGAVVGWLAGTVLRIRRAHVEEAMARAGVGRANARAMYRSLGTSLVEWIWLSRRPRVPASSFVTLDEPLRAALEQAHARGRGVVLATAHTGNWEVAGAAIAERYPLTAIVKTMHVGWVDRFCRSARGGRGVVAVPPQGALAHARLALERGGMVAMLLDQVPDRRAHSVPIAFLGATADVDRAPAALAAAMGATLVVAASRREGRGTQRVELLLGLHPPDRGRRAWIDEATRGSTRALERFVRDWPSEWLWMHRRWRRPAS